MKASIIVPVYNDSRISSCIESLLKQEYPVEEREIIVVDNGCDEATKACIKQFAAEGAICYVEEPNRGAYIARNRGLEKACGEVIAFIDADCVAQKNWLSRLLVPFDNPKIGGAGGEIRKNQAETWVQRASADLAAQQVVLQTLPFVPHPYIVTANAAYRRAVLYKVGGFDTAFRSGGDVDMAQKVQNQEYDLAIASGAVVYHSPRRSLREYYKQYFGYAVGHALLFKKYRIQMHRFYFVNTYPLMGLWMLAKRSFTLHFLFSASHGHTASAGLLRLIEYCALICGNLYGSLKHRVLFL